jgi:hypothetical protein
VFVPGSERLTDADIDDIRAFKIRMVANMPDAAFNQMRFAFRHKMDIGSLYRITHRLAMLSGVIPKYYDCCIKSCVSYGGKYHHHKVCPVCGEARYVANSTRPRRVFCYIPLIPRLQKLFANPKVSKNLLYRHNYTRTGDIADVFDGEHYRNLCRTKVTVDGKQLPHCYFSGKRDIAFSICLDSYLLYKRRRGGPSAMPILLQLYNLKPEIRTHLSHLICLGVIPGPKAPKELNTFLEAFEDECVQLAYGVPTFDSLEQTIFSLHAFNLFPQGDINAIEKFLDIKGHNGKVPCRSCKIQAVNNPDEFADKTYYVPLTFPGGKAFRNAPLRKHSDWQQIFQKIQHAVTKSKKEEIAVASGIKGMPVIGRVGSIDFARGVPWDFMHLLFENIVKNLVNLWMGKFKGLDDGIGDYIIPKHIWKQIGEETVATVKNLPAAFVRSLGNLAEDQTTYTAESWAFWFMHLGPILLKGRLGDQYYKNYSLLVTIMKTCIQFSITEEELTTLEAKIIAWIVGFEKYGSLSFCGCTEPN